MTSNLLTPINIATAPKRNKPYIIRDKKLKGFHLKVYPSGRKTFFISLSCGGTRHSERIGDAAEISLDVGRELATARMRLIGLAVRKAPKSLDMDALEVIGADATFEAVTEIVFGWYERRWKPSTMKVNRDYLRYQIMPYFKGKIIAAITRKDVETWFSTLGHVTEAAKMRARAGY